jgi:hypothetical protein
MNRTNDANNIMYHMVSIYAFQFMIYEVESSTSIIQFYTPKFLAALML